MSSRGGFDRIIGQEIARRVLEKAVESGGPTHAYLFLGPRGAGFHTTAEWVDLTSFRPKAEALARFLWQRGAWPG